MVKSTSLLSANNIKLTGIHRSSRIFPRLPPSEQSEGPFGAVLQGFPRQFTSGLSQKHGRELFGQQCSDQLCSAGYGDIRISIATAFNSKSDQNSSSSLFAGRVMTHIKGHAGPTQYGAHQLANFPAAEQPSLQGVADAIHNRHNGGRMRKLPKEQPLPTCSFLSNSTRR
jgi:hypothetical protein